jgi:AraC-like DNA-binding protein
LASQGTTFEALVVQIRRQRVETLLERTSYSLTEIAFLTGFSQASAMHRAFKRWTRMTPAAFREARRVA